MSRDMRATSNESNKPIHMTSMASNSRFDLGREGPGVELRCKRAVADLAVCWVSDAMTLKGLSPIGGN
jgi:hypothetical protein